jgi:hypothetical protein
MPIQFANEVLKPWDELNSLTAQPYALDPQISDATRLAVALANAINHTGDRMAVDQNIDQKTFKNRLKQKSKEYRLVCDVSDMAKHSKLSLANRENEIYITSMFEWSAVQGFRFIRNSIRIKHVGDGEFDFLEASLAAISFIRTEFQFTIQWNRRISESSEPFRPQAALHHDSRFCIQMKAVQLQFLSRSGPNSYTPCDPPLVEFIVL